MSQRQPTPVVPLAAGAGPENPPCPACGEPLFGLIDARRGLDGPVRRCESCGLAVVGDPGGTEEALAGLDRLGGRESPTIANRDGFSAWLGGAGWSALQPGARFLYTVESARRLVANRDQVVRAARWAPAASLAAMWQTVLNSVTFGRNLALGALGRARPVPAARPWQRRIDWLVTVLVAVPAAVIALPLEALAAALRRGGVLRLRLELL